MRRRAGALNSHAGSEFSQAQVREAFAFGCASEIVAGDGRRTSALPHRGSAARIVQQNADPLDNRLNSTLGNDEPCYAVLDEIAMPFDVVSNGNAARSAGF